MGVYNTVTISTTDKDEQYASIINYLNSLDGITAEMYTDEDWDLGTYGNPTGVRFTFDGTNISGFYAYYRDMYYTAACAKNGETYLLKYSNTPYTSYSGITIHSYIDDNCKIISMKSNLSDRTGLMIVLLTIGEIKLVGYKAWDGNSNSFTDISGLTFEDVNDDIRIPYTYTNMFPYAAPAGTLDFLNQAYFVNGSNVKKFTTEFLKECSAVNLLSSASLPAPLGNYLAIGAHCLAPLDEEGGN